MSFETTAFLKYAGAVNLNNNKPGPSFISDSKWKMQKLNGGFGWGVTDDVTLRAVWIQTHTQRGSSIYTTPAMFSCLNLLMQTFITPVLSGYAFLFFDANIKWWCSSCRWLACQKTVVGLWIWGIYCFSTSFFWKLSSLHKKILHVCRSNGKGRKYWCSHGLYITGLQAMMYAITPTHSLWSVRDLCYSDMAAELHRNAHFLQ